MALAVGSSRSLPQGLLGPGWHPRHAGSGGPPYPWPSGLPARNSPVSKPVISAANPSLSWRRRLRRA